MLMIMFDVRVCVIVWKCGQRTDSNAQCAHMYDNIYAGGQLTVFVFCFVFAVSTLWYGNIFVFFFISLRCALKLSIHL